MYTLMRNTGSSVGISVLQAMTIRNGATVHARLIEQVRPDNPALNAAMPGFDFNVPVQVARLNALITQQASMVAYIDSFWFLFIVTLAAMPLLLLLRKPAKSAGGGGDVPLHVD